MIGSRYSYQMTSTDPRVWVFDGCERIGWLDPETKKLVRLVSEEQTNAMLAEALKRRPPAVG